MDIVINKGTSFAIADEVGDMLPGKKAGFYWQDTRFLNRYELFINGVKPIVLTGRQVDYFSAVHYLANPEIDGIPEDSVAIARKRIIGESLHEDLEIANHGVNTVQLEVRFRFDTDFADIFGIKAGLKMEKLPSEFFVNEERSSMTFRHQSGEFFRQTMVVFSEPPEFGEKTASFAITLAPAEEWVVCIDFLARTMPGDSAPEVACKALSMVDTRLKRPVEWARKAPRLVTDYDILQHAYQQSLDDMVALQLEEPGLEKVGIVPAAGIPWYVTCFGRDSLIAAYQTLPYLTDMSYGVLRNLARYQGREARSSNEEEPGKILHEIRWNAMTSEGRVPHQLYYGTVDATPLFIVLLAEVYKWTADKEFLRELKEPLLKALAWIDEYGDKDNDGFIEYQKMSEYGLDNQGWKDSRDSVRFADGGLAEPPIAVCEAQGYVFRAKLGAAGVLDALGDTGTAARLRDEAAELKERFNRDFWMKDAQYFAEALDKDKNRVDSITSNPGQLLWSGIVDDDKADLVRQRLLLRDMFSGWGIRTMSARMPAYNPVSYHNGTVWPHDNAIIAMGLMEHGFFDEALRVVDGILDAGQYFAYQRLPEVFSGFERASSVVPIEYPTSSSPQAWASGASMMMLSTILGLKASAEERLITMKPRLPAGVYRIHLAGLHIGDSYVSFEVLKEGEELTLNITENPGSFRFKLERWPEEREPGYRKTG